MYYNLNKRNKKKVIDSFNVMSYRSSFNKNTVPCYLSVTCENEFLDKVPLFSSSILSWTKWGKKPRGKLSIQFVLLWHRTTTIITKIGRKPVDHESDTVESIETILPSSISVDVLLDVCSLHFDNLWKSQVHYVLLLMEMF